MKLNFNILEKIPLNLWLTIQQYSITLDYIHSCIDQPEPNYLIKHDHARLHLIIYPMSSNFT